MRLKIYIVFLFCFLFFIQSCSNIEYSLINIGETQLLIPTPTGYCNINNLPIGAKSFLETFDIEKAGIGNKRIATFITENDQSKVINNETPNMSSYIYIEIYKDWELKNFSKEKFLEIKLMIKKDNVESAEKAKNDIELIISNKAELLSQGFNFNMDYKLEETHTLGILFENDNSIGLGALMKYNVSINNKNLDYVMIGAFSITKVNNKVIYLYVKNELQNKEDINLASDLIKKWTNQILEVNKDENVN